MTDNNAQARGSRPGDARRAARPRAHDPPAHRRRGGGAVRRRVAADHGRARVRARSRARQAVVGEHGRIELGRATSTSSSSDSSTGTSSSTDSSSARARARAATRAAGRQQRHHEPVMSATIELPVEQRDAFACFGSRVHGDRGRRPRGRCRRGGRAGTPPAARVARPVLALRGRQRADPAERRPRGDRGRLADDAPGRRRPRSTPRDATGGLVDPTLRRRDRARRLRRRTSKVTACRSAVALALAPDRAPGGPAPDASWRLVRTDRRAGTVTRPPGVRHRPRRDRQGRVRRRARVAARRLRRVRRRLRRRHAARRAARAGARGARGEPVRRLDLHTFALASGGVATSGIGRRSWLDRDGRPAHHLLDPATGRPAFTGVVQVDRARPDRDRGGVAGEGGAPERARRAPSGSSCTAARSSSRTGTSWCSSRAGTRLTGRLVSGASAHGTTTASSSGESRATTYSAGSVSETFSSTCVSRGGTYTRSPRLEHQLLLEVVAPLDPQRSREHVHRALAVLVVVGPRLRAGRHPEHGHVDVLRAGRGLRDLAIRRPRRAARRGPRRA